MTVWLGLLLTVCAIVVLVVTSWRRRVPSTELGSVSTQWLSEHREFERNSSDR